MTTLGLRDLAFLAAGQAAPGPTDPQFANVSLLLHGDASPLVDSSSGLRSISATGTAAYSTTQAKFGSGSIFFGNSSANRVSTPSNQAFAFGTGDFTVEAWVYMLGQNTYQTLLEIGNHQNASGVVFLCGTDSSGSVYSGAFYGARLTSTLNQWIHLAYCRSSGTLRGFVNGAQVFSTAFANNLTDTSQVTIGAAPVGSAASAALYAFNGYIDDLRITKGVARYTSAFTPPTAAFPDA